LHGYDGVIRGLGYAAPNRFRHSLCAPAVGHSRRREFGVLSRPVGGPVAGDRTLGAVTEVPLARLRLWPGNVRLIRWHRLVDLMASMTADRAMLWARPLVALPDGTVILGNQRLIAARKLGWKSIPVLIVDLDRDRAQLWALRDNNAYGEWDETALAELLPELPADGLALLLT